jgi:diguanylate cyclase (GGDEF)-like protein
MDKWEAEFDPEAEDKGWRRFAKDNVFTRKVHENRISREKFKEARAPQTRFFSEEELADFEESVMYDKLTGLHSPFAFDRRFKFEVKRAKRYRRPLALLLFTIDGLDNIGRDYGKMCINDCLKTAARLIQAAIRDVDIAAVTSSGPFAILFPETYSSRATVVGERIRFKLKKEKINDILSSSPITASIGIVSFPTHAREEEALFQKALQFLSTAQEQGGDRVVTDSG